MREKEEGGKALHQPLVIPHLKHVPHLAALAIGRFARGDLQQVNRAIDAQVLGVGALNQLAPHLLWQLHLARRQSI